MSNTHLTDIFIGLGSNLGNRLVNLATARNLLHSFGVQLTETSSVYETEPWGMDHTLPFMNQVAKVSWNGTPDELLKTLFLIETQMGRTRDGAGYLPRIIDLDILFIGNQTVREEQLVVPHPLISERRFVLQPLCEIDPGFIHPQLQVSVFQLLTQCSDKGWIRKLS